MTPAQERAFAIVVAAERVIRRVAVRRHVPADDIPDVVQRVTLTAWRLIRADRLVVDPSRDLRSVVRSWLAGIAHFECGPRSRSQRSIASHGAVDFETFAGGDVAAQLEAREALRQIQYRLNRREAALLEALARQESREEIAARLNVTVPTVNVLIHRLRTHLRRNLARG